MDTSKNVNSPIGSVVRIRAGNGNGKCWFGGTCEHDLEYWISYGHSAFGYSTRECCKEHLQEFLLNSLERVAGWGEPLPVIVTSRRSARLLCGKEENGMITLGERNG